MNKVHLRDNKQIYREFDVIASCSLSSPLLTLH